MLAFDARLRFIRQRFIRLRRIDRTRADLLLRLLLLLLMLLLYRGPAQPDTTRATGQSTEGRGGQLLGLLLLTSSVSIPGELLVLLVQMLRSLLERIIGTSPGRQLIE